MAAESRQITEALRDRLRTAHFHVDLSTVTGTHRVVVAEPSADGPPLTPYVYVGPPSLQTVYESDMGQYVLVATHTWAGIVAPTGLDPEATLLETLDLVDDVATSLLSGHQDVAETVLYQLEQLLITADDVLGGSTEMGPEFGVVLGTITWRKHLLAGA